MPLKCDKCGSFKVEHIGGSLHIFKESDGTYSAKRTDNSVQDNVSFKMQCKVCGQTFIRQLKPWPLKNGRYIIQ